MFDTSLTTTGKRREAFYGLEPTLAKPKPGRSLGGAVLAIQRPIRTAVAALSSSHLQGEPQSTRIFETKIGPGATLEPEHLRLAWLLVNACYLCAKVKHQDRLPSIEEGATWFFGNAQAARQAIVAFTPDSIAAANRALSACLANDELDALYPYVIEPHGHVSRSCMRKDAALDTRRAKKAEGVYYTPADVANFLVNELARHQGPQSAWLDPACGTGVFLRAAVRHASTSCINDEFSPLDFITNHIFGIDRSALATDCTTFILLLELSAPDFSGMIPFDAWKLIKKNIACLDSLTLSPNDLRIECIFSSEKDCSRLSHIFPHSDKISFDLLIMNPPYAGSTSRVPARGKWDAAAVSEGAKIELHLAFMEMMWRLESFKASAAVLPLSVATNTTKSYKKIRTHFVNSHGIKEFLFFDREPQALFGEDVKTRNAIIFRSQSLTSEVYSSRLLKWTAPQRESIFSRNRLARIEPSLCFNFIPKVGSEEEGNAYSQLCSLRADTLDLDFIEKFSRASLSQLTSSDFECSNTLAIGGTAYNFINVFHLEDVSTHATTSAQLSTSPIIFIKFRSSDACHAAYSMLSSRLAFWLWRVEGDGFHLTSDFVRKLPLWKILNDKESMELLADYGKELRAWSGRELITSLNSGKETYSFQCTFEHSAALEVEEHLLRTLLGKCNFSLELDRILHATISIDGKVRRSITTKTNKKQ